MLGQGAFGVVYLGLNVETGESIVAYLLYATSNQPTNNNKNDNDNDDDDDDNNCNTK